MFEHNGIKIEFSESTGKFYAGGLESSSLAGIKKKLDKEKAFVKFDALINKRWGGGIERVEIVGVAKGRGKYGHRAMPKWKDASGNEHTIIYEATAENEAALNRVFETRKAADKEMEEMKARHGAAYTEAWSAVKKIEPPAA